MKVCSIQTDIRRPSRGQPRIECPSLCQRLCYPVNAPTLKTYIAFRQQTFSRPYFQQLAVLQELSPAHWSKEPDSVVLHAIALQVAGNHLFMLSLLGAASARVRVGWF